MNKTLTCIAAFFAFTFLSIPISYSQIRSRSSIGVGVGINQPMQNGYRIGRDRVIQANIRLNRRLTLMPTLGVENIKGNNKGAYNGYYFTESGRSVGLVFLNPAMRYYFSKTLFGFAGPSVYIGGENASSSGLGGTAGAGYDWPVDDYSSLELSLRADVLPVYSKTVPVAGLRLAYKFNFSARY
ncbi:hypothetical protein [Mucilaginibacter lacusdianchii]|uniref:hypothetical protein n=1 Tax=Mucilaginibacter lacusdianchii TaxID=2684211 RepID=UPI00131E29AD|nr:hypothetical protein [Mucilaginibacter sp. JXJ CY 39]